MRTRRGRATVFDLLRSRARPSFAINETLTGREIPGGSNDQCLLPQVRSFPCHGLTGSMAMANMARADNGPHKRC